MTSEQLIYHQKNSITLYSLKNFEDPLTRNKFKSSDMDIYIDFEASEESMTIYRKPKIEDSLARNMFRRSKGYL